MAKWSRILRKQNHKAVKMASKPRNDKGYQDDKEPNNVMNLQWMAMLVGMIEQRMVPFANWLTRSRHVLSLRDGFQLAMPFVIVGSLLVPILYPPIAPDTPHAFGLWLHWLARELHPFLFPVYSHTLGLVALIIAFGAASSLAKAYEMPERLCGLGGCMAFLMLIDESRWADSYAATGTQFRKLNTLERWTAVSEKVRPPLGKVLTRNLVTNEFVPAPPEGYQLVKFASSYADGTNQVESVSLEWEDGAWRVVGIVIG